MYNNSEETDSTMIDKNIIESIVSVIASVDNTKKKVEYFLNLLSVYLLFIMIFI